MAVMVATQSRVNGASAFQETRATHGLQDLLMSSVLSVV